MSKDMPKVDSETITVSKKLFDELVDRDLKLLSLEQFGADQGPGRSQADSWYRVASGASDWRAENGLGVEGTATTATSLAECRSK